MIPFSLIMAIASVESGGNPKAVGARGELGILQISAAVVEDCNRIQDLLRFSHEDALIPERAICMFEIYVMHYATKERVGREPTKADIARIWNSGPNGFQNPASLKYWNKVERVLLAELSRTHGEGGKKRTKEYRSWKHMKGRCLCPTDSKFPHYGGRGIKVCSEWINSYEAFLAHVGRAPSPAHSLGRINNDGNYEPGNVRWESPMQQARNTRRNVLWDYNGKRQTIAAWAVETGIKYETLRMRIRAGWSVDKTLGTPTFGTITGSDWKAAFERERLGVHSNPIPQQLRAAISKITSGAEVNLQRQAMGQASN